MTSIQMPQLGETIVEGTILKWLKQEGDTIERDEPLFEISTDKVDTEVPSPVAGTVTKILVAEGETVAVGHGARPRSTRATARPLLTGPPPRRAGESRSRGAGPAQPERSRRGRSASEPAPAPAKPRGPAAQAPGSAAATAAPACPTGAAVADPVARWCGSSPRSTTSTCRRSRGRGTGGRITKKDVRPRSPPAGAGCGADIAASCRQAPASQPAPRAPRLPVGARRRRAKAKRSCR